MAGHLTPCPSCQRHVRVSEEACPFCATSLPASVKARPAPQLPTQRLGRAALLAFGATLSVAGVSSGAVACSSSDESGSNTQQFSNAGSGSGNAGNTNGSSGAGNGNGSGNSGAGNDDDNSVGGNDGNSGGAASGGNGNDGNGGADDGFGGDNGNPVALYGVTPIDPLPDAGKPDIDAGQGPDDPGGVTPLYGLPSMG